MKYSYIDINNIDSLIKHLLDSCKVSNENEVYSFILSLDLYNKIYMTSDNKTFAWTINDNTVYYISNLNDTLLTNVTDIIDKDPDFEQINKLDLYNNEYIDSDKFIINNEYTKIKENK